VHFFFYLFLCAPKEKDIQGAGADKPRDILYGEIKENLIVGREGVKAAVGIR